MVLHHHHQGRLTETPFDRTPFDQMPFDRKYIWPNRRLTEGCLTESSFYRKNSLGRKQNLSKGRLTENILKKVIWPKILLEKLVKWPKWHMIESPFSRKLFRKMVIWPKVHMTGCFFRKMVIWPKGLLIKNSCDRMLFFGKWSFDRKSFSQKVKQHWFIIRIGKAFLIFETADQNRVWLPRCLRRRVPQMKI
jgi:hypothetical protein